MKIKNVLVIYMKGSEDTVKVIKAILKKYNCSYEIIIRDNKKKEIFENKDLVITVGGDGTFLRSAHFIDNNPILGVNSNTDKKEGFFTRANKYNFGSRFDRISNGEYKLLNLTRLKVKINNKELDHTLNEVYVGSRLSYHMARYELQIGNRKEKQKSSGILIGTAAGSYAWIKSCGGDVLPLHSNKCQYIVREPYKGRLIKQKMVKGVLYKKHKIRIKSLMNDGIVIIDSLSSEYKFREGDILTVEVSNRPLKVISF